MSAWIIIGIIALVMLLALILLGRLPRPAWEVTAAALVLGLTGYALQGNPSLVGSPAKLSAKQAAAGEELIKMRADMEKSFSVSRQWTITSDSFARSGNYSLAMAFVQSGLKKYPKNANLWSALGLYAMLASDGQLSKPSAFAFRQARKFNPKQPAADYFEGLAALFEGRAAETLEKWTNAAANAPKEAKWKPRLDAQLAALTEAANRMAEQEKVRSAQSNKN